MKRLTVYTICLLMLGAAVDVQAENQVNERVDAAVDGQVDVENIAGSVRVEGWSQKAVEITGTLGDSLELKVRSKGRRTIIEVKYPEKGDRGTRGRRDADIVVRVPVASSINIETVTADIDVSSVSGNVDVETVSGEVKLEIQSQDIDVETVSGDIELRAKESRIDIESVSGDIDMHLDEGEFDIETVSGDIDVVVGLLRAGGAESISGDVTVDVVLDKGCRLDLEAHSGDIDLVLPKSVSAEIELDTYSGHLYADDLISTPSDDFLSRGDHELEGIWGTGDGRIEISTFSGDIELHAK